VCVCVYVCDAEDSGLCSSFLLSCRLCVCVCVCVRERESVCVVYLGECVYARESVCVCVFDELYSLRF